MKKMIVFLLCATSVSLTAADAARSGFSPLGMRNVAPDVAVMRTKKAWDAFEKVQHAFTVCCVAGFSKKSVDEQWKKVGEVAFQAQQFSEYAKGLKEFKTYHWELIWEAMKWSADFLNALPVKNSPDQENIPVTLIEDAELDAAKLNPQFSSSDESEL